MAILTLRSAIAGALLLATPASAQDYGGSPWYLGADLTMAWIGDTDVSGAHHGRITYDPGLFLSGLKLGYRPAAMATAERAYRFEAELAGRAAPVKNVTGTGSHREDGTATVGGIMANAYIDFSPDAVISPYIGGGMGFASMSFSKNPGLGIADKDSGDTVAAGQFMVGLTYRSPAWSRTSLSAGYRFFATDDMHFDGQGRDAKLSAIRSHELTTGLTWNF